MPNGYQKVSVNLSDDVVNKVKEMADTDGTTITEIIRRALSAYRYIDTQRRAGKTVYIHDPTVDDTERVIFL